MTAKRSYETPKMEVIRFDYKEQLVASGDEMSIAEVPGSSDGGQWIIINNTGVQDCGWLV